MAIRLLLILALLLAVLWLLRRPARRAPASSVSAQRPVESLLRCRHCGVHVAASGAVLDRDGQAFCSQSHRDQHRES